MDIFYFTIIYNSFSPIIFCNNYRKFTFIIFIKEYKLQDILQTLYIHLNTRIPLSSKVK
jgi:hypothetical protein